MSERVVSGLQRPSPRQSTRRPQRNECLLRECVAMWTMRFDVYRIPASSVRRFTAFRATARGSRGDRSIEHATRWDHDNVLCPLWSHAGSFRRNLTFISTRCCRRFPRVKWRRRQIACCGTGSTERSLRMVSYSARNAS